MGEDRRWARAALFGVKKNERKSAAANSPRQLPPQARVMGAIARTRSRVRGARGRRGKKPGCPKLAEVRFLDILGHRGEQDVAKRPRVVPTRREVFGAERSAFGSNMWISGALIGCALIVGKLCRLNALRFDRVLKKSEIKHARVPSSPPRERAPLRRLRVAAKRASVFFSKGSRSRGPPDEFRMRLPIIAVGITWWFKAALNRRTPKGRHAFLRNSP
jgi:hypothetical protein